MIHIVTDSCVDLPEYLLQENNIYVVPLTIRVNDKEFIEGVNITPQMGATVSTYAGKSGIIVAY